MTLLQVFRIAFLALGKNRLRSFLTALGVVIGVASVIAMIAFGDGARTKVEESFSSMGSNLLIVRSGSSRGGGARGGAGTLPSMTWEDLGAIRRLPSVAYAAPLLRTGAQVISEEMNWNTSIQGTTPDYFHIRDWRPAEGDSFSESDVAGNVKVALLGRTVADNLFGPGQSAVGRLIRIKNVPFEVVGVLEKKGQSSYGQDNDDAVFIPSGAYLARIEGGLQKFVPGIIYVSARVSSATAENEIKGLLRDRHRIPDGEADDFSIRNLTEMAEARQEGTRTLTALLAAIAAVSLLVGGIGIMNIMLVSVTERTREIGLRMAVGARPRDILAQFLVESLTLSVTGGLIGIVLGLFAASRFTAYFDWPMRIDPIVILLAVGFSAIVGVVFGLYPARKASRLDPIQALRYE
jgi:putative ABC transport system permease protein